MNVKYFKFILSLSKILFERVLDKSKVKNWDQMNLKLSREDFKCKTITDKEFQCHISVVCQKNL